VKCNHPDKPTTPLGKILSNIPTRRSTPGSEYLLPFENVKHRAAVRVIDFWPNKLEDFAVGRRVSEYEVLSDYSGGESTDNEEDMRLFREGKATAAKKLGSGDLPCASRMLIIKQEVLRIRCGW
jgi:protection-of-telomeres protein 1